MKKNLFNLISLLFIANSINAQTFQKTFGSTGDDYATDVIQTSDKGYAVMGVLGYGKVYLLKTDSFGNKQWSKTLALQTPSSGEPRAFSQTSDGGYIFSGVINYSSTYYSYVVKTDGLGNVTWSKMHVALSNIMSIKQTIEGDYIAVGRRFYDSKSTLVRFNSTGNIMWSRTLQMFNTALDVIQLASDSSFVTCYYSSSNFTMSRFSKNANLIWSKAIIGSSFATGTGLGHLHENGNDVQVTCNTGSCGGLLSVNKNGTNAKILGSSCQFYNYFISDACPASNKGSFLVGQFNVSSAGYGTRDIFLALIDSLGLPVWAKQIGGVNDEVPASIKRTKDKGAILAGSTKSFSSGKNDIYLIKTDSLGQSGCHTSALTFSTSTQMVGLTNYTGIVDSLYNNVTTQQNVTISNPLEVMYDACVCNPPVASFSPNSNGNDMQDNSTWADKWYWSCTCTSGIDSTVINKFYYDPMIPNGTYTVCLKVKNSCGVDSICHPITYVFYPVSVKENGENIVNNVYPNPFHDKLIISREEATANVNVVQVRIINSLGALIYSDKMEETQKELQLGALAPGLYFIQFSSGDKILSRKLIKE